MKKVLSIDGGGIRGIIPALLLAHIENESKKPIAELFDLIAGTSTGGILALGLTQHNEGKIEYSALDLANLYKDNGQTIFNNSFWHKVESLSGFQDEKFSADGIESVLEQYFKNHLIKEAKTPVLVTSYDIEQRQPIFFKSWKEQWAELKIRQVARATSAAPTYFEPAYFEVGGKPRAFVDGGVFINNPAMSALVEAKKLFPDEEILLVSIGTGEQTETILYENAKDWGKVKWLVPLMSCMFDGMSDAVNYQIKQLLNENYYRFQIKLTKASDQMDLASNENIQNLFEEADLLIEQEKEQLKQLLDIIL
ncbi:MAG: patatin-like phospholipase family protein [Bacteroidales bacterium]|nr:patatin-like phospholipase family protein [Bacteroidales bacterium]